MGSKTVLTHSQVPGEISFSSGISACRRAQQWTPGGSLPYSETSGVRGLLGPNEGFVTYFTKVEGATNRRATKETGACAIPPHGDAGGAHGCRIQLPTGRFDAQRSAAGVAFLEAALHKAMSQGVAELKLRAGTGPC